MFLCFQFCTVFFLDEESGLDIVSTELLVSQRSLILYVDIYRIEQVIRNLITNAVRKLTSDCPDRKASEFSSFFPSAGEVHSEWRRSQCWHLLRVVQLWHLPRQWR